MSDYSLGHGPVMMQRFKKRAAIDGSRFIEPLLPKQGRVVDLGCGNGALAYRVAESNQNLKIIAIDKELHKLTKGLPLEQANLSFIEGDAYHLPLQSNSVDLIYLHAVCMYLNPVEKVLAEAYRVLKPHGKIALRNGLSVVNNMELFSDGELLKKVLSHTSAIISLLQNRQNKTNAIV